MKSVSNTYKILILGGGISAGYFVHHFLQAVSPENKGKHDIRIVSEEKNTPYERPALTKGLLATGKDSSAFGVPMWEEGRAYNTADYADMGVTIINDVADKVNPKERTVNLKSGDVLPYDVLIVATGLGPRVLKTQQSQQVHTVYTYDDVMKLREKITVMGYSPARKNKKILVFGGGINGAEVVSSVHQFSKNPLVWGFPSERVISNILPAEESERLVKMAESVDVSVYPQSRFENNILYTSDGGEITNFGLVIGCVGSVPSTSMLPEDLLNSSGRLIVNENLRSMDDRIFGIGDVIAIEGESNGGTVKFPCDVGSARKSARYLAHLLSGVSMGIPYDSGVVTRYSVFMKVLWIMFGRPVGTEHKFEDGSQCLRVYVDKFNKIVGVYIFNHERCHDRTPQELIGKTMKDVDRRKSVSEILDYLKNL